MSQGPRCRVWQGDHGSKWVLRAALSVTRLTSSHRCHLPAMSTAPPVWDVPPLSTEALFESQNGYEGFWDLRLGLGCESSSTNCLQAAEVMLGSLSLEASALQPQQFLRPEGGRHVFAQIPEGGGTQKKSREPKTLVSPKPPTWKL